MTPKRTEPAIATVCPFQPGELVYAYLRYSTDDQNLDSQERAVRDWCATNQLVLGRVFIDEARSGKNVAGRREFLLMIDAMTSQDLRPRPVGLVLWNHARFARDIDDAQYFKAKLRRAGYRLHSLIDTIPDGDEGRVIEAMIDYSNAKERKTRSREAKRGLHDRAAQGYNTGGWPPVGYVRSAPIELGRKKNGEMRYAYKWEIDAETAARVRRAWQMRLQGKSYWEVHRATGLFKSVNSYVTMFVNLTYTGVRKCGELQVEGAHPAYVTRAEFERVQQMKRLLGGNLKAPGGDPDYVRRTNSPLLLSGILYCGVCGAAMVGDTLRGHPYYRCGRKQRQGKASCDSHKIVAWYVHQFVTGWVADNVLTLDKFVAAREAINTALGGDQAELQARRAQLIADLEHLDRRVHRLVDAIEQVGLTPAIEARLGERKADARRLETQLAGVEEALQHGRVELEDDALEVLAQDQRAQLLGGPVAEARAILRAAVVRVDLGVDRLKIHYVPPLMDPKQVLSECPQRWQFVLPVTIMDVPFPRLKRGHGSPAYVVAP